MGSPIGNVILDRRLPDLQGHLAQLNNFLPHVLGQKQDLVMDTSISASLLICLKTFNELVTTVQRQVATSSETIDPSLWDDELGRLRLWAANIGARQTGQSGLDYRLRDASHIKDRINKLLQDLRGILQEVEELLLEEEESQQSLASDTTSGHGDSGTELQQIYRSVVVTIDGLFQMSTLVRKPAPHNFLMGPTSLEVSAYEPYDRDHVRNKFPKVEAFLVRRLGMAMTRRRRYLKHRERHCSKLSAGLNIAEGKPRDEAPSLYSETEITDLRATVVDLEDQSSDSGISQTSYASTLMSGGDVTMPPPPKESRGGALFQCPYCFLLITVSSSRSWHKHLFEDLLPYSCTISTCSTPHKVYPTQREWLRHLNTSHAAEWSWNREGPTQSNTVGQRELKTSAICPLCEDIFHWERQFERHIARHLQELALFVLPSSDEDAENTESEDRPDSLRSSDDEESVTNKHQPVTDWQADGEEDNKFRPLEEDFEKASSPRDGSISVADCSIEERHEHAFILESDISEESTVTDEMARILGAKLGAHLKGNGQQNTVSLANQSEDREVEGKDLNGFAAQGVAGAGREGPSQMTKSLPRSTEALRKSSLSALCSDQP